MVDTVPGDISTTFTISVGTEVFGRIDFDGDEDWYRAELIAGRTYRMTLLEDGGDGASPIDLDLNDAAGNFLASNHSGDGSDAVLYFTPTVSGTYYLDAGSHQESVGDYRLLLEEIPGDSIAGDALTTATLGLDSNEGGILEFANDVDWYRVEAMAGESYFVSLIGENSGALWEPLLGLYDANSVLQFETDSGLVAPPNASGAAGFSFESDEDAVFYLSASGNTDQAEGGEYRINIGRFLTGTGSDDTIRGEGSGDRIDGLDGNDKLYGRDGADLLFGDAGDDKLYGENDADQLFGGEGRDQLFGGDGGDYLDGEGGNDTLKGGNDDDRLVDLQGDNKLYGNSGEDNLRAGDGNDFLDGGAGDDFLNGGGGNNTLKGGDGDDFLRSDFGNSKLYGNDGSDRLFADDGRDYLNGGEGEDVLFGVGGDDRLIGGADFDQLFAGDGDDKLEGNDGDDWLFGEAGEDLLKGGDGNDLVDGGADADKMYGGNGEDTLIGTAGDFMCGGNDDDRFRFTELAAGTVRIDDFTLSSGEFDVVVIEALFRQASEDDFRATTTVFEQGGDTFLDFSTVEGTGGTAVDFDGVIRLEDFSGGDFGVGAFTSLDDISDTSVDLFGRDCFDFDLF